MPSDAPEGRDAASEESPLILVVDDSPVDREMARRILGKETPWRVEVAADANAALRTIGQHTPDLVVTDMLMPGMDGLELIEKIGRDFPLVPTILMTAHGSEETAVQALRKGAANYVPKRSLASRLMQTVSDVLSISRSDREKFRLAEFWASTELQFQLDNDVSLVPLLVKHLQHYLTSVQHCSRAELVRVGVALNEALHNAILHGNLELDSELREQGPEDYYGLAERRRREAPYRERKVHITAVETPREARYVIRDEGPGFEPEAIAYDPDDPTHLRKPSGRGLFLIRTFMDEVRFNPQGNEITMVHRRVDEAVDEN